MTDGQTANVGHQKPTCFVIIGFGLKTDHATGRTLNLDDTYEKLIKPACNKAGLNCFRAIDVNVAGSIDQLMYEWIYQADYVIADLSTLNANVLYELGVRHAQRPKTTLVIMEDEGFKRLPFDLSHTVIYNYSHLGEAIADAEAARFVAKFSETLSKVVSSPPEIDSPVFTFLRGMEPPAWRDANQQIAELRAKLDAQRIADAAPLDSLADLAGQSLGSIISRAEAAKNRKDYATAIRLFRAASERNPRDIFLRQRLALVTYKNKEKDADAKAAIEALKEAELILERDCDLNISIDPETLGLGGAVNKRLHERTGDLRCFDKCVEFYERGFYIKQDYYNGINLAYMLTLKATLVDDPFDARVNYFQANRIRRRVVDICDKLIAASDFNRRNDVGWVYQTLAQAYLGLGEEERIGDLLPRIREVDDKFDIDTFLKQNEQLVDAIQSFKARYPEQSPPSGGAAEVKSPPLPRNCDTGKSQDGPPSPSAASELPETGSSASPTHAASSGPITIDLGRIHDRPVKSVEISCKVEYE